MRFRFLIPLLTLLALAWSAAAAAYPWPLKPFDKQHPIRANFGDPRTRFLNTMLTDGLQGPGTFLFHNGIDIAAPAGTPVYPVISGKVRYIDDAAVSVKTKGRGVFQYFHLAITVPDGQQVVAGRTVLGYVMHAYDHVHLSEIRGGRVWNPLARGGIAPYRDRTVPQVRAINVRPAGSILPFDSSTVSRATSIPERSAAGSMKRRWTSATCAGTAPRRRCSSRSRTTPRPAVRLTLPARLRKPGGRSASAPRRGRRKRVSPRTGCLSRHDASDRRCPVLRCQQQERPARRRTSAAGGGGSRLRSGR